MWSMDVWMDPRERRSGGGADRTIGHTVGGLVLVLVAASSIGLLRSCGVDRGLTAQLGRKLSGLIGGLCGRQVAHLSRQAKERISCVSLVASFLLF